jgi:hypothetical protein
MVMVKKAPTIIKDSSPVIQFADTATNITNVWLRVFLAKERLTEKQLDVTTALTTRYATYISDGVKEPYASKFLFSAEIRKEICKELVISAPHLNNTFNALTKKNILSKEGKQYIINPAIVPAKSITFKFTEVDDEQGKNRE